MGMRLITTTNVTVDGVMQGLGGAEEDRSGGFDRGGWAIPLVDAEAGAYLDELYGAAAGFLFGRRTYEIFAASWGTFDDPSANPIASALNSRPKYLVSSTLRTPMWSETTVLGPDLAAEVRSLLDEGDGYLLVPGSPTLVRWLLAHELVDQLDLVTYPVVLGQGRRLFPDAGPDIALELLTSSTTKGGITMQSYRPAGRPRYQTETVHPQDLGR